MLTKHTPGPWHLQLVEEWPFGVKVLAGEKEILSQSAFCHSSEQKTRRDCELGIGFEYKNDTFTTRAEAVASIKEQDANARLIAAAPELLEKCEKIVAWLDRLANQANEADAKNYRKTAEDVRKTIHKAEGKL